MSTSHTHPPGGGITAFPKLDFRSGQHRGERGLAWVGTVPPAAGSDEQRIQWVLDRSVDHRLLAVPCERDPQWIIDYLVRLGTENADAFETIVDGNYRDYADFRVYRVRRGICLGPWDVALGFATGVLSAMQVLRDARAASGHIAVPLQVSWPNPLDRALFTFAATAIDTTSRARTWRAALRHPTRVVRALRHLPVFGEADRDELTPLVEQFGEDLVLQLESPAILLALWAAPRWLRRLVADRLARHVAGLIASLPAQAQITLHLCYGNLGDRELIAPESLDNHVLFLKLLAGQLSRYDRSLPTVHIPVAYGPHPPPIHSGFYAPLRDLHEGYDLIAGVIDEHQPITSAAALTQFEAAARRRAIAVATTCGLGRHTEHDADLAAMVMRALTDPTVTAAGLTTVLLNALAVNRNRASDMRRHVRALPPATSRPTAGTATDATDRFGTNLPPPTPPLTDNSGEGAES